VTAYHRIEQLLRERTGLDAEVIGSKSIERTIDALTESEGIEGVDRCLAMLRSSSETFGKLLARVLVSETWFFRDRECFRFLRRYLEETGLAGAGGKVRILSCPCSTGEEAYSIAMVLLQMKAGASDFRVDAVDINPNAIEAARAGRYGRGSFRGQIGAYRERYFSPAGDGFRIQPEVAEAVHFFTENIAAPDALADHEAYQIIFCKNLLIYLTEEARQRVAVNLDRLLVPNGLLFTGHSEVMSVLPYGYVPVKHPRSFACIKTRKNPAGTVVPPLRRKAVHPGPSFAPPRSVVTGGGEKKPASNGPQGSAGNDAEPGPSSDALAEIRALADHGALQEASERCERFLKDHPSNKEAYCLMGLISLGLDSFDQAEDFFQRALYLDPCHYEALLHVGLLYQKKGDRARASIIEDRMRRTRQMEKDGQNLR